MITYNVNEGEGNLIVHISGDNSNYTVSYDHGNLIFENEYKKFVVPEVNAKTIRYPRQDPNTTQSKYYFSNLRGIYRDTTPTDFGISDIVDADLSSTHFTEEIILGGINDKVPVIAPIGVTIYVNGNVVASGTLVDNGDIIKFQITASSEADTLSNINLSIGEITKSFNISTIAMLALYEFTNHTFTNCGRYGAKGPILTECISTYSHDWFNDSNNFSMINQGIQIWTVPADGLYNIKAVGAAGGSVTDTNENGASAGYGYTISGDFSLIKGEKINILVGQRGQNISTTGQQAGPGGGGSFIWKLNESVPLLIGAGGNGESWDGHTVRDPDGQSSTSTTTLSSRGRGSDGASWNVDANVGSPTYNHAQSILNGGNGANYSNDNSLLETVTLAASSVAGGGFGGGGGGYTGGIPKATNDYANSHTGQGAASYITANATNIKNVGLNILYTHGSVSITKLS